MEDESVKESSNLDLDEEQAYREQIEAEIDATIARADATYRVILKNINDEMKQYEYGGTKRLDTETFSKNRNFMKKAVQRFVQRENYRITHLYSKCPKRIPLNFDSNSLAEEYLLQQKSLYLTELGLKLGHTIRREHLNITEAIEVFTKSRIAATVMKFNGYNAKTLVFYDYDKKLYTFDDILASRWLTVLMGSASSTNLKTFIMTLQSLEDKLAIYNPLPRWKIAVGNGVYNTVTHKLEAQSPMATVTSRIETNYNRQSEQPEFANGMTFEKLVTDLANGHLDRVELIMQMLKSIILGYTKSPAVFILVGAGGDGKSLFMSLISNIIGSDNTGALNFADMNDDSKALEAAQRRLIIGMDNSSNLVVKNTAFLKSAASKEVVSFFRKYLTAVSLQVTGMVVQLCNAIPKFAENGQAIRRRIIAILCENSHYEKGDELFGLQEQINNPHWHEYILSRILDESTCPYYTDFNDVDRGVLNAALDSDDPIGSFFDELAQNGVLDNSTPALPRSFVYSAYLDWMATNYPGSHPHSSRTFNGRASQILREYGFSSVGSQPVRLSTVSKTYKMSLEALFGYLSEGKAVQETINLGAATRVWVRTKNTNKVAKRNGKRSPEKCDAITFFNIWEDAVSDVEHNPESYRDLLLECGVQFEIYDIAAKSEFDNSDENVDMKNEELDEYLEASYARYMNAHGIRPDVDDGYEPPDLAATPRLGEQILQQVAQQEIEFNTLREIREQKQKEIAEKEINLDEMDGADYYSLSDDEILDHIDTLTDLDNIEKFKLGKLLSVSPDIMWLQRKGHRHRLLNVLEWLSKCETISGKDPESKLAYAGIIDRMMSQLNKVSVSDMNSEVVSQLRLVQDDDQSSKMLILRDVIIAITEEMEK